MKRGYLKRGTKKLRKASLLPIAKLKKKLDIVFSAYIRNQGDTCYTCGVAVEGSNKQAGHFVSRARQSTRWDIRNVKIQCYRCNIWLRGNAAEFSARLVDELGVMEFSALVRLSREVKQWDRKEIQELIEKYSNL